jgi:hypothetical protein
VARRRRGAGRAITRTWRSSTRSSMLRSATLCLHRGLGRPRTTRTRSRAPSTRPSPRTPTQDAGGTATTATFSEAVIWALRH